jgi:hypothetical protein
VNPFAGHWSTFGSTGMLWLEVVDRAKGQQTVSACSDGQPTCGTSGAAAWTVYYTGAYQNSGVGGFLAGCPKSQDGHGLDGWYKSSPSSGQHQHGTISITASANDVSCSGMYKETVGRQFGRLRRRVHRRLCRQRPHRQRGATPIAAEQELDGDRSDNGRRA